MTETQAQVEVQLYLFFYTELRIKTCNKLQIKWLDLMDLAACFLYAEHTGLEINNTGLIW